MKDNAKQSLPVALDGGVLLALATDDPSAKDIKERILQARYSAVCSEIALTELQYILCRRIGWSEANRKVRLLLESKLVRPVETSLLVDEASRMKCERALALPDCFTLALAKLNDCVALFARKEREIAEEMRKTPLPVKIQFLVF